jgi:hypothetical protein
MEVILRVIKNRNSRIRQIYTYCLSKLPDSAHEEFRFLDQEGNRLETVLATVAKLNQLLIQQIEWLLEAGENFVEGIGIELPGEFCPISYFLKKAREEKALLLMYINGKS